MYDGPSSVKMLEPHEQSVISWRVFDLKHSRSEYSQSRHEEIFEKNLFASDLVKNGFPIGPESAKALLK